MKPTFKDNNTIMKLYKEMIKHQDDPKMQTLVQANQKQIDHNLKIYEYPTPESFATENSFCIECGTNLNEDNRCVGCQKEYGW